MKISELIKALADELVTSGDLDVYIRDEDSNNGEEELAEEILVGRKKFTITSKDFS